MSMNSEVAGVTISERACLLMVAEGRSLPEISKLMKLSQRAVEGMLCEVEKKLHARNRLHAVCVAMLKGIIAF